MVTPSALPSASSWAASVGSCPSPWLVPGSATKPAPEAAITGAASARLVTPPHRFKRLSSRLTSARDGAWADTSPTICEPSGAVDGWAPTAGCTACGWARGIAPTGPGWDVEAVDERERHDHHVCREASSGHPATG